MVLVAELAAVLWFGLIVVACSMATAAKNDGAEPDASWEVGE